MVKVGTYNTAFNDVLGINIEKLDIFKSDGLIRHMEKRNHIKALEYINCISDIIQSPDYIGVNPNEKETKSIELIKKYDTGILLGLKLDRDNDFLYIATMYEIQESKINRRLHNGRIKKFHVKPE